MKIKLLNLTAFMLMLLTIAGCRKNGTQSNISGVYHGLLVSNQQVSWTQTSTWDTAINSEITLTLVNQSTLKIVFPGNTTADTIQQHAVDSSAIPVASTYYNGGGYTNLFYNVYFFTAHDSIYIEAFYPPGNGHSFTYYFMGKK